MPRSEGEGKKVFGFRSNAAAECVSLAVKDLMRKDEHQLQFHIGPGSAEGQEEGNFEFRILSEELAWQYEPTAEEEITSKSAVTKTIPTVGQAADSDGRVTGDNARREGE